MIVIVIKRIAPILFFLLLTGQLYGQREVKDSLEVLLKTKLDIPARVDVLNQLAYQYYDFNDSIAFEYAHEALRIALQDNYKKGVKYAYTLVGLGYATKSRYKEAILHYRLSEKIKVNESYSDSPYNLILLGNLYREIAKFDSARLMYTQAKTIALRADRSHLSNVYKNLASIAIILWENQKALKYLDSAAAISQHKPDRNGYVQIEIMSYYGQAYQNTLEFDKSDKYFKEMCKEAFELDDYYHQITCKLNQAHLAFNRGNFNEALTICFEGIMLSKKYTFPPQYVKLLIQIGEIYVELSQYDVASQYLFQALRISEKSGLDFHTASIYSELSWINKEHGNYGIAMDYIDKSQAIRERIGYQLGIANCYSVRGLIYFLQKEYPKSISQHETALKIRESIDYTEGVSVSIFSLSLVYEKLNQVDKAIDLVKKAIAIQEKINNKLSLGISYDNIAGLLIKQRRLKEAVTYLEKAMLLGKETKSLLLLRNSAQNFTNYYETSQDYKNALKYQKMYQSLNDSIYSESSAIKLTEVGALYNVEKNQQEIESLNQKQRIQNDRIKFQESQLLKRNLIIVSAALGFLLISIAGFVGYQNYLIKSRSNKQLVILNREMTEQKEELQAQSEELVEANQLVAQVNIELEEKVEYRTTELKQAYKELDTFFYRSSHDFRRPLTTFMGLSDVARITVTDTNALVLFDKVHETAHNFDKMLMKLQSISDMGSQQLAYQEVILQELLIAALNNFKADLDTHSIQSFIAVELKESFISYPALVTIIIQNLIENSINFCGTNNPFVKLYVSKENDHLKLIVEDNGQGIEMACQHRIFEMYFRANEKSKGNGLGLYVVKKSVEKLGGTISFVSQVGVGSTFIVLLPFEQKVVDFS